MDATPPPIEDELLLRCARLQLREEDRARLPALLAKGIDWPRLLDLADAHGLQSLLFRHLGSSGPAIPREIETRLWNHQEQLRRKNRRMADELHSILQLLESHGIPALPYKGPVLAQLAFGDLALREFGDLDLLLPAGSILPAKTLLGELGYSLMYPLTPAIEAALLRAPAQYDLKLRRKQPEIMVELHWKTDREFPVEPMDDPEWWLRLGTVPFEGHRVRSLAPHELVLALCLHGSKHYWSSLHWLVDIAELLRREPPLDWPWLLARADRLRAGRRLALALFLLDESMAVELPPSVRIWMGSHPAMARLAAHLAAAWFELPRAQPGSFQRLRLNLSLYSSFGQQVRHVARLLTQPSLAEWTRWPLPQPLFILYLPLRIGRLLAKQLNRLRRGH